jgi:hypothetical protein
LWAGAAGPLLMAGAMWVGVFFGPPNALAATAQADSPSFTLDTVQTPTSLGGRATANSGVFALDTRPYLGPFFAGGSSDSSLFAVDTRGGGTAVPNELRAVEVLPDRKVRFELLAQPGYRYTIQASSNLLNWESLGSVLATNSVMTYKDVSAAGFSARFYRAVLE